MFIRWKRRERLTCHQRGPHKCGHRKHAAVLTPVLLHSVRTRGSSRHIRVWTFPASIRECCLGDPAVRERWWHCIDGSLEDLAVFMEEEGRELDLGRVETQLGRVVAPPPGRRRPSGRLSRHSSSDPFALLGLHWPCSEADLRAAWRRAAFEHHPDRGGTHDDFVRVQRAYQDCLAVARAAAVATA